MKNVHTLKIEAETGLELQYPNHNKKVEAKSQYLLFTPPIRRYEIKIIRLPIVAIYGIGIFHLEESVGKINS